MTDTIPEFPAGTPDDPAPLPAAGTRTDLVADAAERSVVLTDAQMNRDTARGLLGSPTQVSLGKGHGRGPAVYSSEARLLYRLVVEHRARAATDGQKASDRRLALLVLHAWLYFGEDRVPLEQVRRAAKTAVGNPRRSQADAGRYAQAVVRAIDIHGALPAAAAKLRAGLVTELTSRTPDRSALVPLVAAVFEPPVRWGRQRLAKGETLREPLPLHRQRGPAFAPFTVQTITDGLWLKMHAVRALGAQQVSNEQWVRAGRLFRADWREYEQQRATYAPAAPDELAATYADRRGVLSSPDQALDTLLLQLGLVLLKPELRA